MPKLTAQLEEVMGRRYAASAPYWQKFEDFSKKLGDTSRAFAFAGIALIWVFKTSSASGEPRLPLYLVIAGFFFCIGLASDLLRLFLAAFIAKYDAIYALMDGNIVGADRIMYNLFNRVALEWMVILLEMSCVLLGFGFTLYHLTDVIG